MASEDLDYDLHGVQGTGSHHLETRIVTYPFERYEIKVELTPSNEFIGIVEVSVNKRFLSYRQKLTSWGSQGFHDTEDFYREPEAE